jgi:hypothetical protein
MLAKSQVDACRNLSHKPCNHDWTGTTPLQVQYKNSANDNLSKENALMTIGKVPADIEDARTLLSNYWRKAGQERLKTPMQYTRSAHLVSGEKRHTQEG